MKINSSINWFMGGVLGLAIMGLSFPAFSIGLDVPSSLGGGDAGTKDPSTACTIAANKKLKADKED